jgi:hypothetical protein
MQVENTIPSAEAAAKNRDTIAAAHPSLLKLARGPVLVVLSAFVVLLGGSFASVRAAESALPGDTLYMLKLITEQTRLVLTSSKPSKVVLKVEFTMRRVEDLKTIIEAPDDEITERDERVSRVTDILKQDFNTLKEQLEDVQNEDVAVETAEAAKLVDKELAEVVKALDDAKEDVSSEVIIDIMDAQAGAADAGIKALEVLIEAVKDDEAKDVMSDEEIGESLTIHAGVAADAIADALELSESSTGTSTIEQAGEGASSSTESGLELAKDAEDALEEVQLLIDEDRIDEAIDKLKEASAISFLAQSQTEEELIALGDEAIDGEAVAGEAYLTEESGTTTESSSKETSAEESETPPDTEEPTETPTEPVTAEGSS